MSRRRAIAVSVVVDWLGRSFPVRRAKRIERITLLGAVRGALRSPAAASKCTHEKRRYVKLEYERSTMALCRSPPRGAIAARRACGARHARPHGYTCRRTGQASPAATAGVCHPTRPLRARRRAYPQAARCAVEMLIIENPQNAVFSCCGRLHVGSVPPRFTSAPSAARK